MHELKFTAIWYDDYHSEVLVEASNDDFEGKVEILLPYNKCFEMIDELDGFPNNLSDEVIFFSGDDLQHSTLGLKFYCRDSLGSTSILVSMQKQEAQSSKNETNSANIVVYCDPQGIKNFCLQLRDVLAGKRKTASLSMI